MNKRNERFVLGFLGAVVGVPIVMLMIYSGIKSDTDRAPHGMPVSCAVDGSTLQIRQIWQGRIAEVSLTDDEIYGESIYRGWGPRGGVDLTETRFMNVYRYAPHATFDEDTIVFMNDMNNFNLHMTLDCARAFAERLPDHVELLGYALYQ